MEKGRDTSATLEGLLRQGKEMLQQREKQLNEIAVVLSETNEKYLKVRTTHTLSDFGYKKSSRREPKRVKEEGGV